jgi:hypothetical protein
MSCNRLNTNEATDRALTAAPKYLGLCLWVFVASSGAALAQASQSDSPPAAQPASPVASPPPQTQPNVLERIGDWFDRQFSNMNSDIRKAQENFDRNAKQSLEAAKDAADAVTRLSDQRTVSGRQVCLIASNGAPDCETAANTLCRSKGFSSGKSVDSTSAETCSPRFLMSGRQPGTGECRIETFISRALCTP